MLIISHGEQTVLLTLSARKLTKMFSLNFRNYVCVVITKCGSYKHWILAGYDEDLE